jgi:hypothetical protein
MHDDPAPRPGRPTGADGAELPIFALAASGCAQAQDVGHYVAPAVGRYSREDIFAAVRALLEMLDDVLSKDVDEVAKTLEELLDRAGTEDGVEYAILALLAQRDETREWARTYLTVRAVAKGVTPERVEAFPETRRAISRDDVQRATGAARGERAISDEQFTKAVERARDDAREERVHPLEVDDAPDIDERREPLPAGADETSPERVVNTGFADAPAPDELLDPELPLKQSHDYWFCVEIGEALAHSIEPEHTELPTELLPREVRLVVALFGFPDELAVYAGKDTGELRLAADGTVSVVRQPLADEPRASGLTAKRLFFPVTTPSRTGRYRLRCNIYCQGILVQSRLIRARVVTEPKRQPYSVRARLEYTLSRAIRPSQLGHLPRHKLSLMVNGAGDGTHTFRVWGGDAEERVKHDVTMNDQSLTDLIDQGRVAMRFAAWSDGEEWAEGKKFRYTGDDPDLEQLRVDLARLAKAGYNIYDRLVDTLRGAQEYESFTEVMTEPGYVQLACQDVRLLLPLAVVYDYAPFDPTARLREYSLCDVFERAVEGGSLAAFTCLNGRCPHRGAETVVCPSGFWGYRHFLGLPLSSTLDLPPVLGAEGQRRAVFGFSTELDWAEEHKAELADFVEVSAAGSRKQLFELFGSDAVPQLVYLYCHGGLSGSMPYLLVGAGDDGPITSAYMRDRFSWAGTGPVVVINGCHTTAVRPDHAFELVSAFVRRAHATGVIGTEITVDESLARAFGSAFVRRFAKENQTVGEAVRGARIDLLGRGNPLGLVYLPFALAGLRMRYAPD